MSVLRRRKIVAIWMNHVCVVVKLLFFTTHYRLPNKSFIVIHWLIHNVVISMQLRQLCTQSYLLHRKIATTEAVYNSADFRQGSLELTMGDVLTRDYPFVYAHYRN